MVSLVASFVAVAVLFRVGIGFFETFTGTDIPTFITQVGPNLFDFFGSISDLFKNFFELLPGGIHSIFMLFFLLMFPFLMYKFFKK